METTNEYFIEIAHNDYIGYTYFQVVRKRDKAITYANRSLSKVADRLVKPIWEDGSPVII